MRLNIHSNQWTKYSHHHAQPRQTDEFKTTINGSSAPLGETYEAEYTTLTSPSTPSDNAEQPRLAQPAPAERVPTWAIEAIYHYGKPGTERLVGQGVDLFV